MQLRGNRSCGRVLGLVVPSLLILKSGYMRLSLRTAHPNKHAPLVEPRDLPAGRLRRHRARGGLAHGAP